MSNTVSPQIVCRRCKRPIDASDAYCRHCAAPTGALRSGAGPWWESAWMVLVLLLLILGPLALPLLWRSRRFTVGWKIVLTIIVSGITLYMAWQIGHIMDQLLAPLQELRNLH